MIKTLKSSVALLVATAGLMTVMSLPATAATKKISCYQFSSTNLKLTTKSVTTATCPKGFTKGTPTQAQLQGTNNKGDIDLSVPSSADTLNINGSSFDTLLVTATTSGSTAFPAAKFSSYAAAGSGTGRSGISGGTLNIGFSDQPISATAGTLISTSSNASSTALVNQNFVQVPYLLGGAVVAYNIGNGFDGVKLTAAEVAKIYDGKITQWSDPEIVATNGGANVGLGKKLTALDTQARNTIKVVYRNASSGTTYAFTDWLHAAGGATQTASGSVMEGTGNKWGATNVVGAGNNSQMASNIVNTLGSIGYLEYSYLLLPSNDAVQAALLQDKNGEWLNPNSKDMLKYVANAASSAGEKITAEDFSIVNQAGKNVWPLATYSWAIVAKSQSSAATGQAVVKYLDWSTHYAQYTLASANGYVPLPDAVAAFARKQLAGVTSNGVVLINQKS
jgi:phosphate transport system substrate-binding protein